MRNWPAAILAVLLAVIACLPAAAAERLHWVVKPTNIEAQVDFLGNADPYTVSVIYDRSPGYTVAIWKNGQVQGEFKLANSFGNMLTVRLRGDGREDLAFLMVGGVKEYLQEFKVIGHDGSGFAVMASLTGDEDGKGRKAISQAVDDNAIVLRYSLDASDPGYSGPEAGRPHTKHMRTVRWQGSSYMISDPVQL